MIDILSHIVEFRNGESGQHVQHIKMLTGFLLDRLLQNTDIDLYISFDNERVGTMMGEALLENGLAGGNVLMLGGSAVDSNVAMVEKGFRKVMEDNQVTILDSMHADGWIA